MRQPRNPIGQRRRRGPFSRIAYAFRERQIYLRSEGEVQFITLRPWVQVAVMLAFCAGLFWVAYATVNVAFKDQVLALKERNQYRARLEYEDRIGQLRTTIDKLNRRLLLDQRAYLAKVDEVRLEHDKLVERHQRLSEFFRNGWLPGGSNASSAPQKQGSLETGEKLQIAAAPALASKRYRYHFTSQEQVLEPLQVVRNYMDQMQNREANLISEASAYMNRQNARMSRTFGKLGLNPANVVSRSRHKPANVGGPFVAASSQLNSEVLTSRVNELSQELATWERLKYQSGRLPLWRPMSREHEVTSGFGLRKDPFRRRAAMHAGIDFRGPIGSAVRATAAGTVIKAGRHGGYGRLIEIRHENGVTTRYAHLSKILVKSGQRVKKGDRIGKLGNSGRSTGPHLHYETRVGGNAIDPKRFWRARDVFQEIAR